MGLSFDIKWSQQSGATSAAEVTWGSLTFSSAGVIIWGTSEFEWSGVELLEWLTDNWGTIQHPVAVSGSSISELSTLLSEEDFEAFCWEHNIAQAFGGAKMPDLFLWRDADTGYLSSDNVLVSITVEDFVKFLVELGDAIAAPLAYSGDARSRAGLLGWMICRRSYFYNEKIL